jgi:hypothetical protein
VKAVYDHKGPDHPVTVEGIIPNLSKGKVQDPHDYEDPSLEIHDFTIEVLDEKLSKA